MKIFKVAYDASTEKIIGCALPGPDVDRWIQAGYPILNATEIVSPDFQKVVGGIIVDKTDQDHLPELKKAKLIEAEDNFNLFLLKMPDGTPRYSVPFRQQLMVASASTQAQSVMLWMNSVAAQYANMRADIDDAQTVAALEAVAVSYDTFESLFGVSGTVMPDPNVKSIEVPPISA